MKVACYTRRREFIDYATIPPKVKWATDALAGKPIRRCLTAIKLPKRTRYLVMYAELLPGNSIQVVGHVERNGGLFFIIPNDESLKLAGFTAKARDLMDSGLLLRAEPP